MPFGQRLMWIAIICTAAAPAHAETPQSEVLSCFKQMNQSTDWNTCLNTMFEPCAGEEVGAEAHLACLSSQLEDWQEAKRSVESDVLKALSQKGIENLSGLMLAWPQFVGDKCTAVAEGRADISYDAAKLGCQISEYALLTNELTACVEGRSVEEYCQMEE